MDREAILCEHIVHALRQGHVPVRGLERLVVERQDVQRLLRREIAFSKYGGSWVRFVSGNYGVGKTFLCSWLREEAWKEGFVVAAVDLGRDAPFHRFDVMYQRIMEGIRTAHFQKLPAFEFILQEWLFTVEKEVQQSMGLNPWHHDHRAHMATVVKAHLDQQLATLHIRDASFGQALHRYYMAVQSGNDLVAAAAANWLKGVPSVSTSSRRELGIRGGVAQDNALEFLRAMVALIVHMGYAGLLVIFDEAELICGIARPESRHAAYENIRLLVDGTDRGDFAHCGFLFAGAEDLFNDTLRGIPSYPSLYTRLQPPGGQSKTLESHAPLLELVGLPEASLMEVAHKVRDVHGVAYGWHPAQHLTDDLLQHLMQNAAAQMGETCGTVPRGFLKVLIDVLDDIQGNPHMTASEAIKVTDYADRVEAVERQEAYLTERP